MMRHEFQAMAEGLDFQDAGVVPAEDATDVQIGAPSARPVSRDVIEALRAIIVADNVTSSYWFWMRSSGGAPHLGLAISPSDQALVTKVQKSVQAVWTQHFPAGEILYDLALEDDDALSEQITAMGECLCRLVTP